MDGDHTPTSSLCDKDQEDLTHPMVPPRKKNPAKIKEDGVDGTNKKVRSVAIVECGIPTNVTEKNKSVMNQLTVIKGTQPPRPPPPVRYSEDTSTENISNTKEEKHSEVEPKVKLKPSIPTRPYITKENINKIPISHVEAKIIENISTGSERLSKNEDRLNKEIKSNSGNEITPRKPKPAPRPLKKMGSKPPIPQPRKPSSSFSLEKSDAETETCLEIKQEDRCVLYKKNEKESECIENNTTHLDTTCTKLRNNLANNIVGNDTKFVLVGEPKDDIKSILSNNEKDNRNNKLENTILKVGMGDLNSIRNSGNDLDDLIIDSCKTISAGNSDVFYSEPNQCLDNTTGVCEWTDKKDRIRDNYKTLSDTSYDDSFRIVTPQNSLTNMKRSLSDSDIQQMCEQLCNNESLTNNTNNNRYDNIKLQQKLDNCDNNGTTLDDLEARNISPSIQQNIKQSLLEHSYQNVAMYASETSALSESLNALQKLHKHPVFFVPKIYSNPNSDERHSNSCDTVFVNETSLSVQEAIYQIPPNNRDSDSEIYTSPPNNKIADFHQENILSHNFNSLASSDRCSGASQESSRFSVASNSSHNSTISEKSITYQNVVPTNGDNNVSNGDKCISSPWKLEVTRTDGDELSTNPSKKQQRTFPKKELDDTSYINVPPSTQPTGSYIEIDYTSHHKEMSTANTNTSKPPKLPSNCFLPTKLVVENESIVSTKGIGRVSTVFDETTGEYHNYFESSEEDESEEKVLEKPKSKLFSIATEILTTEKSFVEGLQLICEDFGGALKAAMGRNTKLLPDGAYTAMFMNIEQIYELDKKFLQELEERMKHWELHQRIGDLVREYGHFLKMYTVYIKGYDSAIHMFHECLSNNMKFFQIVDVFEKSVRAKNMKLSSFLLKPIQRIPSYRLLLTEYLEHLPGDHLDYKDISDGLDIVSEVASHINESMKEGEKFQEVLRIQSQITNCKDIVKPGRYLIKEGTLQKLSRKELQQRTFILFTDALLYCSCTGGQLKLITELPLVGMAVQIPDSQDLKNEFIVISTKRSFLLNAKSAEERESWVEALEAAAQIANEKVGTFITNKGRSPSLVTAELGHSAPPWIPDSRVTMCQICTDPFNIYNRRHHCRACGKVVCNDCSSYEAPLEYLDHEAARVCSICYNQLIDQHTRSSPANRLLSKFKEGKKRKNRLKSLPSTLTEVAAQEEGIQNSGFLRVRKEGKKEKRRWFALKDHVLYMYKASSDPAATSTTPILGYQVRVAGNWDDEDFLFTLSHTGVKDTIVLRAEDKMSAERWVHCLLKATELTS